MGREADGEDGADIRLHLRPQHAFMPAAQRLDGEAVEQPVLRVVHRDLPVPFRELRQAGPEPPPLGAVIVEAAAIAAPAAAHLHQPVADLPRRLVLRREAIGDAQPRVERQMRVMHLLGQDLGGFVMHLQRADGHADLPRRPLDGDGVHAVHDQRLAFVEIGAEDARGEEAAAVIDHDWDLADALHVVIGLAQRVFAGLLAHDDLDQLHLVDGREEMDADEALRLRAGFGEDGDRQGGGVGAVDPALGQLGEGGDIQNIITGLKQRNIGVLITDHNVRETLGIVDRAYIMNSGELLVSGTPDEIIASDRARKFYLGEEFKM